MLALQHKSIHLIDSGLNLQMKNGAGEESGPLRVSTWKTTAKQLQRNLRKLLGPSLARNLPFTREINEFTVSTLNMIV